MDSYGRTVAKTLSWRMVGTLVTASVAWAITGELRFGAAIGLADAVVKLILFYVHERAWNRVQFGRVRPPDYHV